MFCLSVSRLIGRLVNLSLLLYTNKTSTSTLPRLRSSKTQTNKVNRRFRQKGVSPFPRFNFLFFYYDGLGFVPDGWTPYFSLVSLHAKRFFPGVVSSTLLVFLMSSPFVFVVCLLVFDDVWCLFAISPGFDHFSVMLLLFVVLVDLVTHCAQALAP